MYATNIYDVYRVALHIQGLQIDDRLQEGDLTLIQHIALVEMSNGKERRNYSFATKYCSWHRPEIFPIYDFYVDYVLWLYAQQDSFFGADRFHRSKLWDDYPTFTHTVSAFREYYSLKQFSLRQIDNFLWLHGREAYRVAHP